MFVCFVCFVLFVCLFCLFVCFFACLFVCLFFVCLCVCLCVCVCVFVWFVFFCFVCLFFCFVCLFCLFSYLIIHLLLLLWLLLWLLYIIYYILLLLFIIVIIIVPTILSLISQGLFFPPRTGRGCRPWVLWSSAASWICGWANPRAAWGPWCGRPWDGGASEGPQLDAKNWEKLGKTDGSRTDGSIFFRFLGDLRWFKSNFMKHPNNWGT